MDEIISCIKDVLPIAVSKVINEGVNVYDLISAGKIKISTTPDPKLGDYGIAIHPVLKAVDHEKWGEVGQAISQELYLLARDRCQVERVDFINGYINVTINYSGVLKRLAREFSSGEIFARLLKVGNGVKVIVEHTSANPVHPLHIGSGRNSVIGDTFARLLKKLGFNVETRFYVNDLGRQAAVLAYGVKIVQSRGITKPEGLKQDHWYGIIYALTNVLIELDRLRSDLNIKITRLLNRAEEVCKDLLNVTTDDPLFIDIKLLLCELAWKKHLKVDALKYVKKLNIMLKRVPSRNALKERHPGLIEIAEGVSEIRKILREYKDFLSAERNLSTYYPELYNALRSAITDYKRAEEEIRKLMMDAEKGEPETLALFRSVAESVLEGFKQTLKSLSITFDGFDFESSSEVLGTTYEIVRALTKTRYAKVINGGAIEVDLNSASQENEYIRSLFYPDQAGRFIVQRSDGTTLYVTRDIAYSLYKFKKLGAQKVYNVIAVEQTREQKQLKAVLYILGFIEEAKNLNHFSYEMVHLKGMRMSGRRGRYYTLDEMLLDSEMVSLRRLYERAGNKGAEWLKDIARSIAVSNVRALLLSVDPNKVLTFDPKKIEEVEYGTIIEYAFVRAQGVIRNLWNLEYMNKVDQILSRLAEIANSVEGLALSPDEKRLVEALLKFEGTLLEAYKDMKPNRVLEYAVELSTEFNRFYEKYPIISETNTSVKAARILITILTLLTLSELMDVMGLPKLRRM